MLPAHVYAYQGLIEGLVKDLNEMKGCEAVAVEMKKTIEAWKMATAEQAIMEVKICRLAKGLQTGRAKVVPGARGQRRGHQQGFDGSGCATQSGDTSAYKSRTHCSKGDRGRGGRGRR